MKLMITGVGLCTSYINSVESFADILISGNLYHKSKSEFKRDALKKALKEANAEKLNIITVGLPIMGGAFVSNLTEALRIACNKTEVAIVCSQKGEDGQLDVAVLVIKNNKEEPAWAQIVGIDNNNNNDKIESFDYKIYKNKGPVSDACSVIVGCIALRYGLDFSESKIVNECFFDARIAENKPVNAVIKDGNIIILKQANIAYTTKIKLNKNIIPVPFITTEELEEKIDLLKKDLSSKSIESISKSQMIQYHKAEKDAKMLVLVANNSESLKEQINEFCKNKPKWFEQGFCWRTLEGSCYSASPAGSNAKICLMNPPGGMFVKLPFYRLYRSIPELRNYIVDNQIDTQSNIELINRYYFEIITVMLTIESLKLLGIKNDSVIGCSLGEISLPLVMDIATVDDEQINVELSIKKTICEVINMLEKLLNSQDLLSIKYFKHKINKMGKWYLKCDYEKVKQEIEKEGKNAPVFLTIVGSQRDVIICGENDLCVSIISRLKCYGAQFNDPIYAHTPVLEPYRDKIKKPLIRSGLHLKKNLDCIVYSTSYLKPLDSSVEMFASNFADCLIKQVDMTKIYNKAYEDGCRMFIDLGSSGLCSNWAKENFKNKSDVLITSLFEGKSSEDSLLMMLTQMMTNRISFDIEKFFNRFCWTSINDDKEVYTDIKLKKNNCIKSNIYKTHQEKLKYSDVRPSQLEVSDIKSVEIKQAAIKLSSSKKIGKNKKLVNKSNLKESLIKNENVNNTILSELINRQIEFNYRAYKNYIMFEKNLISKFELVYRNDDSITKNKVVNKARNQKKNLIESKKSLYDYNQILEMTGGYMSNVLGSQYIAVDRYPVRARMPLPPYLFVSRILNIHGKFGELKAGSYIEGEYDVSDDCILKISDENISSVVFSEAAHIGIFLAGYIGVDVQLNGKTKFRITDVSTKYIKGDLPKIGETVRLFFSIDRFVKNLDTILIFCTFKVFHKGELVIDAQEIGGFFKQESLDSGGGIINNKNLVTMKKSKENKLYKPIISKRYFDKNEVHAFLLGDYKKCFGFDSMNKKYRYKVCKEAVLIDRVIEVSETEGNYGLGYIIAEKDIDETFWPYKCHFKNDPIFPGTIMLEGVIQVSTFFQTLMGLYSTSKQISAHMRTNSAVKSIFRGEVKPGCHLLRFRVDPVDVRKVEDGILFVMDAAVYCDGMQIVKQQNAAVIIG